MSSTGHGAKRVENDFYPSPKECIDPIKERIRWEKVGSLYEPCKGTGAILNEVPDHVVTDWSEIADGRDYLGPDVSTFPQVDLAWTNPPFLTAQQFIARQLAHAKAVVNLLRINFLGSAKRRPWLQANTPTHLYGLSERPSFVDVCKGKEVKTYGAGGKVLKKEKIKGCGWAFQKVDQVKECPNCGGTVSAGTDSIEYAWFAWDHVGIMADKPGIHIL